MNPKFLTKIASRAAREVYRVKLVGTLTCNKSDGRSPKLSHKEVDIIASLNHSNIVKFIGCGTNGNLQQSLHETMEVSIEPYLGMESVQMNLLIP